MIFEMTLDYTVIIPMTLVVAISYGLRRSVTKDSIYTRKLVLRGDPVPESLRADLQFTRRASSIMNTRMEIFPAATRLQDLPCDTNKAFVITDGSGAVGGVVTGESLTALVHANPTDVIGDIAQRNYVVVSPGDSVWQVVSAMRSTDSAFALIAAHDGILLASRVQGIITRKEIMNTLARDMEPFGI
jgi:CIC family chloride channel protein